MNTETLNSIIHDIKTDVIDIIQLRIELIKVESVEYLAKLQSSLITTIIVGIVGTMTLFFLSITLALYLSQLLGDAYTGFGIVSIGYVLIGLLTILLRKKIIKRPLENLIINNLLNHEK